MKTWNWMLLVLAAFLAGGALGMYGDRAMVQRRIRAYGEEKSMRESFDNIVNQLKADDN